MIDLLFDFLCGCLYLIGYPLGLTYEEISIYICIYLWPILCCLSALPIFIISLISITKHKIIGIILTILSAIYSGYYIFYTKLIIERYNIHNPNSFNNCMLDLKSAAEILNVTYKELNIFIYVILFFFIIISNYIIYKIIKRYKNK